MLIEAHSHILACIDDGSNSVETSKRMIAEMRKQGVTKIYATPHFYAHRERSLERYLEKRQAAWEQLGDQYELQKYKEIKFIFIGSGAWYDELVRMIKSHEIRNVLLQPYEPIDNIDLVYSLGDIKIVSIGKNVTKCSMPSKTWNILSCGVPVICQVDSDSDLNRLINDNEIGYTIEPDDFQTLAKQIIELYEKESIRKVMGKNAREIAVKQFDSKISLQKYKDVIIHLCTDNGE